MAADGTTLLSRRATNDEPELLKLIGDVLDLADGRQVSWVDMTGGEPALLLALLVNPQREVLYMPGRLVNRASDGYRGEGKTRARPTPETPTSSPTRPGCVATCGPAAPATKPLSSSNCGLMRFPSLAAGGQRLDGAGMPPMG
ncbi:hypothetical protein ADL25_45315 [Streptomyces sp. NRRL F-5122]|nr:hypothetical protein ADL25_45315 [Streptomyces sp. NRRL F-5122]